VDSSVSIAAVGRPAPAFELPEARGGTFALADALAGGSHALLVFLRHYG
jgi:peroxiredoxin